MTKTYCKYCGGKLEIETKKCTECGRFNGKPKSERKFPKWAFAFILIVSILASSGAAFGVTYFAYERKDGIISQKEEAAYSKGEKNAKASAESSNQTNYDQVYESGYTAGYKKRTEELAATTVPVKKEVKLTPGEYTIGVDIAPGRYTATAVSDGGSISTSGGNNSLYTYITNGETYTFNLYEEGTLSLSLTAVFTAQ